MNEGATLRKVIFREETHTVMWVPTKAQARAFAAQLFRARKTFVCTPVDAEAWEFTIAEHNWPNRWEDGW